MLKVGDTVRIKLEADITLLKPEEKVALRMCGRVGQIACFNNGSEHSVDTGNWIVQGAGWRSSFWDRELTKSGKKYLSPNTLGNFPKRRK